MGDSQAVLPIAGGTVEYLVLDLMFMPNPFSSLSLTILQAALARVSALDILVYLFKRADVDDRQPKAIKCIEWVLPAFVPGALQNLRIVFHGSSYRLQRLLQHPANTVVLGSLQQTILGLSPKSVTFTAATTKHNTRSLLTGLLEQSFPVLYERGLAKTVFPEVNVSHESSVHTVLVSPDGQWVASADDDSVILWRTEDGSVVKNWDVPFIRGLMFTSESRHLVICSRGRLLLWNMQPPFDLATEVPLEHEAKTCVWSPDGTLCALSGQQNWHDVFRIRIYRTGTLEARSAHQLTLPHRDTNSCGSTTPAFSHDSRRLLFTQSLTDSTDDGSEESESITWIWDVDSTAPPRKLMNHGPPVVVSTFNTVDSTQVRLTLDDGTVQVRDVASGTVLISLGGGEEAGTLSWPLCSSDGRLVATGSSRDGIGRLCNIETGAVLWARGAEGPHDTTRVSSRWLSFSPDGTRILSTSSDAAAKLWDTHTGRPVLSLTAHINSVEAASFSPDGRRIAAGYEDGTVRLWNTEDGACLAVFTEHVVPVTRLAFSLDGEIMCSAARDGTVQIRRLRGMLEH
ncbi:quinon protein alcohol dehydrogenase-like superfamily [Cerioporus squamosus]|nr:quinon protein alcohol dehydrogenase-like superfamily [Cerioporus squamosus]